MTDDTEEFQNYRNTVHEKRRKRDKARIRHETKVLRLAGGGKPVPLRGLSVFRDRACDVPADCFTRLGITASETRIGATAFLTEKPSQPGDRTLLAAVLKGGVVVSKEFLLNDGKGASIKYKSALTSRRNVWLSAKFKETQPAAAKIIIDTNEATQFLSLATASRRQQHTHSRNTHSHTRGTRKKRTTHTKYNTDTCDTSNMPGDAWEVEDAWVRGRVHGEEKSRRGGEGQAFPHSWHCDDEGAKNKGR